MDATLASTNLQGFIDYLSSDKYVKWHFVNDPRWAHENHQDDQGWCGHIQLNFYRTLYKRFWNIGRKCRRFTFYPVNDSHCVTWYEGIIIDTFFNILVYKGKYLPLTNSPVVDRPKDCFDLYYRVPLVKWSFEEISLKQTNSFSRQYFPPFLP